MPFSFAHPAVVLPVSRLAGRLTLTSALVLGSISPDLWYLLPGGNRSVSHSWIGILQFCLPVGLGMWLFWRIFLQCALHSLYPPALRATLPARATWHWSDTITAPTSIVFGAWSHQIWDRLTHDPHVEFLNSHAPPELLGRTHAWDTVLQYSSSIAGISLVLTWLVLSAIVRTSGNPWLDRIWPGKLRIVLWTVFVIIPVAIGGLLTWLFLHKHAHESFPIKGLVNGSARHMLAGLAIELVAFATAHGLIKAWKRLHRPIK